MRDRHSKQIPVESALAVDDRIIIASYPQSAAPQLIPPSRRAGGAVELTGPPQGSKAVRPQPSWDDLLEYYRECVLSDETEPALMTVGDHGTYGVGAPP